MKKHLSKVTAIVSGVFGLVFIILLLVTAFGGLDASDFDNRLVKVLLFVFGGCYLATTIATVLFEFADRMPVREIQVSQSGKGGVRVTPAVIRKLVRKHLRELDGIRYRRMGLYLTEYGVRLDISVGCSEGRRAEETGKLVQELVADVCAHELDLEFCAINVRVSTFGSDYKPDMDKLAEAAEAEPTLDVPDGPVSDEPEPEYIDLDARAAEAHAAEAATEGKAAPEEKVTEQESEAEEKAEPEEKSEEPTIEETEYKA